MKINDIYTLALGSAYGASARISVASACARTMTAYLRVKNSVIYVFTGWRLALSGDSAGKKALPAQRARA